MRSSGLVVHLPLTLALVALSPLGCLAETSTIRPAEDASEPEDAMPRDAARDATAADADAEPIDAAPDTGPRPDSGPDAGFDDYFWFPDIEPIAQAKCISCHGPSPTGGAGNSIVTWADTRATAVNLGTPMYQEMATHVSAGHPLPPAAQVTNVERTKIQGWAAKGGPEGTPPDSGVHPDADAPDLGEADAGATDATATD